jgi:hypothetical protein
MAGTRPTDSRSVPAGDPHRGGADTRDVTRRVSADGECQAHRGGIETRADGFGAIDAGTPYAARPLPPLAHGHEDLVALADTVVHRLLAIGLATRSLLAEIHDPAVAQLAEPIVDGLDTAIDEIRATVFGLQPWSKHHRS